MGTSLRGLASGISTRLPIFGFLGLLVTGCASRPDVVNPSFPVATEETEADLRRMEAEPVRPRRPLLIVTGFMGPGIAAWSLRGRFGRLLGDRQILTVSLAECWSLESCRKKILGAVDRAFSAPTTPVAMATRTTMPTAPQGPAETTEVDVIGYSLGGIAARYSADVPEPDPPAGSARLRPRRLHIARLFTISSPHRGAEDARRMPLLIPLQRELRPGSALLDRLNTVAPSYPIYPYVRLGDGPVGEANAAPPGRVAWWVSTPAFSDPHNGAYADPRLLADMVRCPDEPPPAGYAGPAIPLATPTAVRAPQAGPLNDG